MRGNHCSVPGPFFVFFFASSYCFEGGGVLLCMYGMYVFFFFFFPFPFFGLGKGGDRDIPPFMYEKTRR
jgi:hypothetical protein